MRRPANGTARGGSACEAEVAEAALPELLRAAAVAASVVEDLDVPGTGRRPTKRALPAGSGPVAFGVAPM
jgi:hypothetical protein